MKHPSRAIASLSLAAALFLGGCGTGADESTVTAQGVTSAVTTSSVTGAVSELTYADLGMSVDLADAVDVTLADGDSQGGSGVSVDGDTVTITTAGTYHVSGTLTSGSLVVDAPDGVVDLVLDGVDITAANVAAINVVEAGQVVLWLADGADNVLADAEGAAVDETVEDAPNATVYSAADLWIAGEGELSVTAHAADAITSKDTLVMVGGDVTVIAADDGVRGKDHLVVTGGTLTADVEGDALRSDNESVSDVRDGDLTLAAGDDGLHSDNVLRIAGGTVRITESAEGIEGAYMYLSGGDVSVVSTDDGINVAGGAEASAETATTTTTVPDAGTAGGGPAGGPPMGDPSAGGQTGGDTIPDNSAGATDAVEDLASLTVSAMDGNGFGGPAEADNGTRFLEFSGGTYVLDTNSDGVDVNGAMTMTGGTLVVSGTEDARNGALDVDDAFTISGGTLAANGTARMAVAPGEGSTQATLALTFGGSVPAGTLITIIDDGGTQIASFTTPKASESFIYSTDALEAGADYTISVGGEVAGTSIGWLVLDGTASDGDTIGTVKAV